MIKLPDEKDTIPITTCLGLFSSVIKSGEPWTETCHRHYEDALSAIERLNATAEPVSDWLKEAERMAELHGMSFVVFRNGGEPKCADPTKVRIEFTDKGLGYPAAPGGQDDET